MAFVSTSSVFVPTFDLADCRTQLETKGFQARNIFNLINISHFAHYHNIINKHDLCKHYFYTFLHEDTLYLLPNKVKGVVQLQMTVIIMDVMSNKNDLMSSEKHKIRFRQNLHNKF